MKRLTIDGGDVCSAEIWETPSGAFATVFDCQGNETRSSCNYFTLDEASEEALRKVLGWVHDFEPASGECEIHGEQE